ncbi:hypothetical protein EZJ43_07750 [Pedobacter changchengzhani]|uniref:Uncharacterized protein n=1 Tax=Pedobacter changchengzhani TaxID=2529274 RepID=A0A4V3A082_9SPHI|nr:hypothetical protein [Pedobacter changchengzhani]TDG36403.1 hypothetical protein EZJ43_07750 [Pedobacter changchengzhani]
MKKIFYPNGLYFKFVIFFSCALIIELILLNIYHDLNTIIKYYYFFLIQFFVIVIYAILGIAQKFIITTDCVTYITLFKRQIFNLEENVFVFGPNSVEPYNDNTFGEVKFKHITKFWIKLKTDDRALEIQNTHYFDMYMSRRYFKKIYNALNSAMEKRHLQDHIEMKNFNR